MKPKHKRILGWALAGAGTAVLIVTLFAVVWQVAYTPEEKTAVITVTLGSISAITGAVLAVINED